MINLLLCLDQMNEEKIISDLKNDGYSIINQYLSIRDLENIKATLFNTLDYIKKDNSKDLQEKYYFIKNFNEKLKAHFYDISATNLEILHHLRNPELIQIIKKFFKNNDLFTGRAAIHIHDDANQHLLDPHQETSQISVDNIVLWIPLFDTNKKLGGLSIYKDSHKHGYFEHTLEHPRLGAKSWTKKYTHVSSEISKKFQRVDLETNAGSAVLLHSALLHSSYPTKEKNFARFVITERFNPLIKVPFLRDENAPLRIPFTGVDYNLIED